MMKKFSLGIQIVTTASIITVILMVFYFSWWPDPRLSSTGLLPNWLGRWTDAAENDQIRTAVPFVLLGVLASVALKVRKVSFSVLILSWIGLVMVGLLAELGQLLVVGRSFDWYDVWWAALGTSVGFCLVFLPALPGKARYRQ